MLIAFYCEILDHHWDKEIYAKMDQIIDSSTLCAEQMKPAATRGSSHFATISMNDYAHDMITVHRSPAATPDCVAYTSAIQNVDRKKFLEAGYCLDIQGASHHCQSMERIRDEEALGLFDCGSVAHVLPATA